MFQRSTSTRFQRRVIKLMLHSSVTRRLEINILHMVATNPYKSHSSIPGKRRYSSPLSALICSAARLNAKDITPATLANVLSDAVSRITRSTHQPAWSSPPSTTHSARKTLHADCCPTQRSPSPLRSSPPINRVCETPGSEVLDMAQSVRTLSLLFATYCGYGRPLLITFLGQHTVAACPSVAY